MTPEVRAARDRLERLLTAGSGRPVIDEAIDADLRTVLAALDRHDAIEQSVLDTARQVAEIGARFGPVPERVEVTWTTNGQCEDCFCCTAAGCHTEPGSTCPTGRLGDSVCPCTGD